MMLWSEEQSGTFARNDTDFLCGGGVYVDDIRLQDEAFGYVLRSPHAHARIRGIDREAALRSPGVLAVFTAADLAGVVRPLGCVMKLTSFDGKPRIEADRAIPAADRARHVGDGVAFVVAETLSQAIAAADLVEIDFKPLPATTDPTQDEHLVPIWPDAPDNTCFDRRFGDGASCRRIFSQADHVVRITLRIPRLVVNAIEPRAAIGTFDRRSGRLTLVANTLHRGSCANGCHACEVEIDPETGECRIISYAAVDDFGHAVNDQVVRGQVQGAVAQGEQAVYDGTSGQVVAGSLLDYALPRAVEVPDVRWVDNGLASSTNIFGAKGCGEAGASAAPPAVMNAIVDALSEYPGVWDLQMPARAGDIRRIVDAKPARDSAYRKA